MHLVVCIKQIIDPEIPPYAFQIDPARKRQVRGGHSLVISTFDENALEVAIQVKEKTGGRVTALCIGDQEAVGALRTALAMGADEAFLISDPAYEEVDPLGKVRLLAAALQRLGEFDGVLCGRQAGDIELGLVGPFLAEMMDLPCITLVANLEPVNGRVRLRRVVEEGYEVVEAPCPFVATVTNDESNVPRLPKVRAIRKAVRTPVPVWTAADLGLEPSTPQPRLRLDDLFIPRWERRCEFIPGENDAAKGEQLAQWLRAQKLI